MIEFKAQDSYLLNTGEVVYTGPAPADNIKKGDSLILSGKVRKIKAIETGLLLRGIKRDDLIGVILE